MSFELWQLSVLGIAAFAAFVVASALGAGGPLLLTPALLLVLPAHSTVAVLTPVMLASNVARVLAFRSHIQRQPCLLASAGALPAAVAGAALMSAMPDALVRSTVAAVVVLSFVVRRVSQVSKPPGAQGLALLGGGVGLISGVAGIAGPITIVVFRQLKLSKERLVATIALFQLGLQLVRLPTYVVTGVFDRNMWPIAAVLVASGLAAVPLAKQLLRSMRHATFERALDSFLVVMALWLVVTALFKSE